MQEVVARLDIVLWLSAQQTLIQLPDSATATYPRQWDLPTECEYENFFKKKQGLVKITTDTWSLAGPR